MKLIKQELSLWVRDGVTFPCLTHIQGLLLGPDPTGVNRELALKDSSFKTTEISRLLEALKTFTPEYTSMIHSLGAGLYPQETLDKIVSDIDASSEKIIAKTNLALRALKGAAKAAAPTPAAPSHQSHNEFFSMSAAAEPLPVPCDISPSAFSSWLTQFKIFSDTGWIPGPPTAREKLSQLRVYLGACLLYTSPSPRDMRRSRMPSSA